MIWRDMAHFSGPCSPIKNQPNTTKWLAPRNPKLSKFSRAAAKAVAIMLASIRASAPGDIMVFAGLLCGIV